MNFVALGTDENESEAEVIEVHGNLTKESADDAQTKPNIDNVNNLSNEALLKSISDNYTSEADDKLETTKNNEDVAVEENQEKAYKINNMRARLPSRDSPTIKDKKSEIKSESNMNSEERISEIEVCESTPFTSILQTPTSSHTSKKYIYTLDTMAITNEAVNACMLHFGEEPSGSKMEIRFIKGLNTALQQNKKLLSSIHTEVEHTELVNILSTVMLKKQTFTKTVSASEVELSQKFLTVSNYFTEIVDAVELNMCYPPLPPPPTLTAKPVTSPIFNTNAQTTGTSTAATPNSNSPPSVNAVGSSSTDLSLSAKDTGSSASHYSMVSVALSDKESNQPVKSSGCCIVM